MATIDLFFLNFGLGHIKIKIKFDFIKKFSTTFIIN